jgi:predicted NAD/FAD-dependent oxidoreductase
VTNPIDQQDVLIVGAGMSGLMAARTLQAAGKSVRILDKGRGVGGRMSTRYIGDARLDHGAQFFTAGDPAFRAHVEGWVRAGVVSAWTQGFAGPDGAVRTDGRTAYRVEGGMNRLPKHLAEGLQVETGARVVGIRTGASGFTLETEAGAGHASCALLLTAPVPQSLALLDLGRLDPGAQSVLTEVRYDPCFAVLAVLEGPSRIPAPGGMKFPDGPIQWMADNRQKGVSPGPTAITIHASAAFSREHLEADREWVSNALLAAASPWLGSAVAEVQVHRWLYSQPLARPEARCVLGSEAPLLLFAGDAFGGAAIQGAALSGLAAAEAILSRSG